MIIESFEDNDFYNFTMGQMIHKHVGDNTEVLFEFKNRTSIPLGMELDLDRLESELWNVVDVVREGLSSKGVAKLRELGFDKTYIERLGMIDWPEELKVWSDDDGQLHITYRGKWLDVIWYESPFLSIINQMWACDQTVPALTGYKNLVSKLELVKKHDLKFMEFGTRRRYSRQWQENVVELAAKAVPDQILGTSNLQLALDYDLRPLGTMAHQLFMVLAAMEYDRKMNEVYNLVMILWEMSWPIHPNLWVALTDTYGTDSFLESFEHFSPKWRGVRQDSGDPFAFGEKIVEFYTRNGIDSKTKTIVFSDGLDVDKMIQLNERFKDRFDQVIFGWGTNLTNDVGVRPLSIVIKPKSANGIPCVKLSDNIEKATGDPEEILKYMERADYSGFYSEKPLY